MFLLSILTWLLYLALGIAGMMLFACVLLGIYLAVGFIAYLLFRIIKGVFA